MYVYTLNSKNNRVRYIGITTKSLDERYKQHVANAKNNSRNYHVYNWMNKHFKEFGIFPHIKLLDTANSIEELKNLETMYISNYKNLTNMTKGGDGISGLKWSESLYKKFSKAVVQYDLKGNYINSYKSMSEAAEAMTGNKKNNTKISLCCGGKRITAYGFIWRKKEDSFYKYKTEQNPTIISEEHKKILSEKMKKNNPSKKGILNSRSRPIGMYKNNEIEKVYITIEIARKEYPAWGIYKSLKTGEERYGFVWKYVDKDIVQSLEKSKIQQ